jgi:uncharacterized protein (DUF1684 family)
MFLLAGCDSGTRRNKANPEYVKKIQEWHKRRIESLTKSTGWLSLAGLFWLNEGANTFGSAPSNDIRFPEDRAPGRIGTFFLQDSVVSVKIMPGVQVNTGGAPVDSMVLKNDMTGDPTELSWGSLVWYVIKRGQQYGVRLKDKQNPNLRNFKGIKMFPIDSVWRVKAKYETYSQPKTIEVPTVLGTMSEVSSLVMTPTEMRLMEPVVSFMPISLVRMVLPSSILTRLTILPVPLLRLQPVLCRRIKIFCR